MSARPPRPSAWEDEDDEASRPVRRWTKEEVRQLSATDPPLSPWRVIAAQAAVGAVVALLGWWLTGRPEVAWSALYGAATAVVPGALVARGMTSPISRLSPMVSAVSVVLWEMAKIAATVALLAAAAWVVNPLSWPALLVALTACLSVYAFALLWRGRARVETPA